MGCLRLLVQNATVGLNCGAPARRRFIFREQSQMRQHLLLELRRSMVLKPADALLESAPAADALLHRAANRCDAVTLIPRKSPRTVWWQTIWHRLDASVRWPCFCPRRAWRRMRCAMPPKIALCYSTNAGNTQVLSSAEIAQALRDPDLAVCASVVLAVRFTVLPAAQDKQWRGQ